jgi:LmbE family N-acetylglucosaminyl deacetylase
MRHSNWSLDKMTARLKTVAQLGRTLIVSPHLDDGVFSCGQLIAATQEVAVATVFAGIPQQLKHLPEWDATAGFETAAQAMIERRKEDQCALDILHASPVWLDFLDSQYDMPATTEKIAVALEKTIRVYRPETVLMPAGLFHSDHVMVHQAALIVRQAYLHCTWLMYEEALYRRIEGLLQQRLAHLLNNGLQATPVALDLLESAELKFQAVQCYASQLRALGSAGRLGHRDTAMPERYWQLAPCSIS